MTADPRLIEALEPLVRRVRTDVTAKKDAAGMSWTREPLTDQRLAKHLNGGPARGVCPIKAGESVTMVGLLDLDSHKGESTWEQMAEAALRVVAELEARYLAPIAFRSSGGRGVHIYVLWDQPQDAYSVRSELTDALAVLGFANGTAGVSRGEIEVFPKQNSVPTEGFGNQFILPLAGMSEPLSLFDMEPVGKETAIGMAWPASAPVPERVAPVRTSVTTIVSDLGLLDRALFALPNTDDTGGDRDWWFKMLCSFKEGGGNQDTARTWSAQHSSHDDARFDLAWDSITVGKDLGADAGVLMRAAEAKGFNEHIVAEFPTYAVSTKSAEPEALPVFKRDGKGAIEPTVTNTVAAVSRSDLIGMQVAYDVFRDEVTVAAPGTTLEWRPMTDADAVTIRMGLERVGFKSAPKELARDACIKVAAENTYDSAILWLDSLVWDGKPRVEKYLQTFMGCNDADDYRRAVSLYLWTALAGRVLQPGVKADMVPIYEGDQGLRKSSSIEAISPAPEFFVEIDFDKDEDNTVRSLRGVLVGEVAELSGLHTRQIEWIKKFVVRKTEKWVPKYKEFATTFARRLVFIGTTNRTDILADETGNRRWLPVHITKADVEGIVANRDQLWAEAAVLFKTNGVMWHGAELLAVEHHENYTIEDAWEPAIATWLASTDDFDESGTANGARAFSTPAVMTGALRLSSKEQDRLAQKRVSAILRGFGYLQKTTRIDGVPTRAWRNASLSLGNGERNGSSVSDFA